MENENNSQTIAVSLVIPAAMKERLRRQAYLHNSSQSEVIRKALAIYLDYLDKVEEEKKDL